MKLSPSGIRRFQKTILDFHRKHGRAFPWRETRDPYAVLVSEVMLQQTQVDRVVPKYLEWMKEFPTVEKLARAPLEKVLLGWQGLGYNRRALNLKRAAEKIVQEYGGKFPRTIPEIDTLPGIGPYTAGAIAAFAYGIPSAFIETNIRTVYLHFFFKGRKKVRDEEILGVVRETVPRQENTTTPPRRLDTPPQLRRGEIREWYNALMDYGAMLKKTAGSQNARSAHYARQSKFKGSRREVRGEILRKATEQKALSVDEVASKEYSVADIFAGLVAEGFLRKEGEKYRLA